ncbi:DUF5013 domain-containing protein [Mucilaginibacter roseus]|uniref:DUF5013 domain-containing protein n=1 Tax=Mucilaginibacter roseus TaxID=1528868 RepID=A0ABS8U5C1_9SPHI|nr:DUF4998 domain-containing protein [Mucilaginibacter roseus]MCD8741032.1 DUF5013 domain-containing protein [Mucilaginibacter roseus]
MKKYLLTKLSACLLLLAMLAACKKQDDYKKFVEGGEISYTGKIDSVKILSGHNRVLINGLFLADPKVTSLKIYWNNYKDSVTVPVTRTQTVDTLSYFVENLTEGVQNFVMYTFDNDGNRSVPVYKTGRVYGDRYITSLSNRPISSALTGSDGVTRIDWLGMDRLTGVFATEVEYTNTSNQTVTVRTPIDSTKTILPNFKTSSDIRYRTLFLPDTISIDTFRTEFVTRYVPQFINQDVTSIYLKNTGSPFNVGAYDGRRWGTVADWTSNAGAKNISGGYGGYEYRGGVGVLSFEAGWGLPALNNGLIYQTITLPAGIYKFVLNDVDQNSGGSRFIAVAEGNTLPNVSDITSSSIAFANISAKELNFTLTEQKTVSLGFGVTIDASGQYIKIKSVRLYKQSYQ